MIRVMHAPLTLGRVAHMGCVPSVHDRSLVTRALCMSVCMTFDNTLTCYMGHLHLRLPWPRGNGSDGNFSLLPAMPMARLS